jgi:hypothetical protein
MEIAIQNSLRSFEEELQFKKIIQLSFQEHQSVVSSKQEMQIAGDGNCLFRCISIIMFDEQKYHQIVREKMLDYLQSDKSRFSSSPNLEGSIDSWIGKMLNCGNPEFSISGEYGDSLSLEILSWMLEKPINVSIRNILTDNEIYSESFGNWFNSKPIELILRGQHFTLLM